MNGATQISSDMMFGRASNPDPPQGSLTGALEGHLMGRTSNVSSDSYNEYKESAKNMAAKTAEKAGQLKDSAIDWFSQFTAQT